MHLDGIIVHLRSWRPKNNDTAIGGIVADVVAHDRVAAGDADAVCPLLEDVDACGANVVVLDGDAGAGIAALGDVQARPAARIVRAHVLDELA